MNLLPFAISWAALALAVLALAVYRRSVIRKEGDFVQVSVTHASPQASNQESLVKKLEGIDKWGKLLTILAVVYALAIVGLLLYNQWETGGRGVQY